IDNGSTDGTEEYFRNKYIYLRNNENMGFPKAVNKGMRNARGRYYVILNNDVLVTKGWLERLISTAEKEERIGMAGPVTNWISGAQLDKNALYRDIEKMEEHAAYVWETNKEQYEAYHRLRGFCLLIKKEVIDKIGGLDERFRIGNYEDDDFCLRVSKGGYICVIAKGVFVHHFGSVTFKEIDVDYDKLLEENKKKFIQKWEFDPELIEMGDLEPDSANRHFQETTHTVDCDTLFERGNELALENKIEEAEKVYKRILEVNPNHSETLHNLACLIYKKGFPEKAVEMLRQAVNLDSGFAQAYNTLGIITSSMGKKKDALGHFKQAVSNNINFDEAYDNYLNTAKELGISVDSMSADFVFYTVGMPFDGDTIYTKGL
ncbi:glycosyltransferase, partial [bacterium]|nr:glycosyltransferase [bacterium]